jgi:O-antigen ligase
MTVFAIVVMTIGLELSQTRAAIGGLALGIVALVALSATRAETRKFALGGLLAIVIAVPGGILLTNGRFTDRLLSPDAVAYAEQTRDVSRLQTIYDLPANPFGHGLGATGGGGNLRDAQGFAVDNVYFATLYETGIVGLGVLLLFQGTMLYYGVRAALRAKSIGANTAFSGIVASQVALLAASWFTQGAFDYAPLSQIFWLFSGAVARSDGWA